TVTLAAHVTDDVQVRNVELLVNGALVRNEISYPFDLTTSLPTIQAAGTVVTLPVRGTDTGGNSTLSDPIAIELVPAPAPVITHLDPADGSTEPSGFREIGVEFSQSMDRSTLTAGSFELLGPNGAIDPLSVRLRGFDSGLILRYPQLTDGNYRFVIHAALLLNRTGLALGATDLVSTFQISVPPPPATVVHAGHFTWTSNLPTVGQLRAVGD